MIIPQSNLAQLFETDLIQQLAKPALATGRRQPVDKALNGSQGLLIIRDMFQ